MTWTVTGVLVIMNIFKPLQLWEEGQQLENIFTDANFLYQSLCCQSGFTGIPLHIKANHCAQTTNTR